MEAINRAYEDADAYRKMMDKCADLSKQQPIVSADEVSATIGGNGSVLVTEATAALPKRYQDRSKYSPAELKGKR